VGVHLVRDDEVIRRTRVLRDLLRERQRWTALTEDELAMPADWRAGFVEGLRAAELIVERDGRK
jgi:hypothetical protein